MALHELPHQESEHEQTDTANGSSCRIHAHGPARMQLSAHDEPLETLSVSLQLETGRPDELRVAFITEYDSLDAWIKLTGAMATEQAHLAEKALPLRV